MSRELAGIDGGAVAVVSEPTRVAQPPGSASLRRWTVWLLAVFTLHNGEELLRYESGAVGPVARWSEVYATDRFVVAVLLLTVAVAALLLPVLARRTPRSARIALLAVGALLGNVVSHVGQAVVLRGDSPGAVTAVLLVLPVGVQLARLLAPLARTGRAGTGGLLVAGALLAIPAIIGSLLLGSAIVG